ENFCSTLERSVYMPDSAHHLLRLISSRKKIAFVAFRLDDRVGSEFPIDFQLPSALCGSPSVVSDDGNTAQGLKSVRRVGVLDNNSLLHALHSFYLRIVK